MATVEDVKRKTMELLGTTNEDDVSYITDEYLNLQYEDENVDAMSGLKDAHPDAAANTWYGHNVSFDGNWYRYHRGDGSYATACSEANYKRAAFATTQHHNTSGRCNHGGGAHSQVSGFSRR